MHYQVILACVAAIFLSSASTSSLSKIDKRLLEKMNSRAKYSALVVWKQQADISAAKNILDRKKKLAFVYKKLTDAATPFQGLLQRKLSIHGLKYKDFYISNMTVIFEASSVTLRKISEMKEVERIYSNDPYRSVPIIEKTFMGRKTVAFGPGDNIKSIDADKVWNDLGITGEGIVIAGNDTGVKWDHPALINSYRGKTANGIDHNYSWHDSIYESAGSSSCGSNTQIPCDDNDHGTHTIGTAIGDDGEGNQIGVAPGSKWIACRNMDDGDGRPSTYIDCYQYFLAPYHFGGDPMLDGRPELAPHVINNSWGCPKSENCFGDELLPILKNIQLAGIFNVVSAGNEGDRGCETIQDPPAMHSATSFTVGAHSHTSGSIASFSSRGPSSFDGEIGPDVTAPGVNIRSSVISGGYSSFMWSGTSMAGPHVAGLVALMWSANENLIGDLETTSRIIQETATATTSSQSCGGVEGSAIPNNTFGYGKINALEAVKAAIAKK